MPKANESTSLDPALEAKLKRLRLRVELSDEETLTVKGVPANQLHFNKGRTWSTPGQTGRLLMPLFPPRRNKDGGF